MSTDRSPTTRRKLWIIGGAIALTALVIAYFASPLLAFRALAQAAEAGDRDRLERTVDFPAVRASLREQLNARLIGALQRDPALTEGPFGALGALLGPSIVDQVVNATVTPEGVAAMVRSGRAPLSDLDRPEPPPPPVIPQGEGAEPPPPPALTQSSRSTRFAYEGLDRFKATIVTSEAPQAPLGWVMERRGLFAWKLVAIELPPESRS